MVFHVLFLSKKIINYGLKLNTKYLEAPDTLFFQLFLSHQLLLSYSTNTHDAPPVFSMSVGDCGVNSHFAGEGKSSCPLTAQEYLSAEPTETEKENLSLHVFSPFLDQIKEERSGRRQLLWHISCTQVSDEDDILTCRSGSWKKINK